MQAPFDALGPKAAAVVLRPTLVSTRLGVEATSWTSFARPFAVLAMAASPGKTCCSLFR